MQNASRIRSFAGRSRQNAVAVSLVLILICIGTCAPAHAQTTAQEALQGLQGPAVAASPVVPQQVRYAGKLTSRAGDTVEAVFRIYTNEQGGDPLWTETQRVTIAEDGSYSVLLGSASAAGLPQTVFLGGAARWLGVSVERSAEQERILISSVPYAMKSADADSLSGRTAADFVTEEQFASQISNLAQSIAAQAARQTFPETAPSGTGSTGFIPLWTNDTTLGDSAIFQSGAGSTAKIGVGTNKPASLLDVDGTITVRSELYLPAASAATAAAGVNSSILELTASSFDKGTSGAVTQKFGLQAIASGNDTAAPSGSLSLLYGAGTAPSTATGFSISPKGIVTFAPTQTFAGTIKSVTGAGPVTATTTSGAVSLGLNTSALETTLNGVYAQLGEADTFTQPIAFSPGQTFPGTITGVSATSPVTAATTSGTVSLGLNTSALETTLNSVYPQLATQNTYAGSAYFETYVTANQGFTGYSTGEYATDSSVLGITGNDSSGSQIYQNRYVINAGIWGDNSGNTTLGTFTNAGVVGTADNNPAGLFYNKSSSYPSVTAINFGTDGTGLFRTLMAASPDGACGIGGSGDLTCTGVVKTLSSTGGGTRKVETYAMQSPENWMEDFGSGLLQNGVAVVNIDPSFAETVSATAGYHVFLTPKGDSRGLYVINETPTSFEVRESSGGTSSLSFDYRIVAKRRGYEAERLTDVTEKFRRESQLAAPPKSSATPGNPRFQARMGKNGQNAAREQVRDPQP